MKKASNLLRGNRKPRQKWQTGDYDRYTEFRFILPYPFLLLCKLMDVTPETLVRDFTANLSYDGHKRQGREKALDHLVNYFIALGYGQQHYTEEDIRQMFREMDAVSLLFPAGGKDKLINLFAAWRDKHQNHWFKKWFRKPRRKLS